MSELRTFRNFRDMGGLICPDGRRIRRFKLFRAPTIAPQNQADWDFLDNLGLDVIVDLRDREEREDRPDRLPAGCDYIPSPVLEEGKYKYIIVSRKAHLRLLFLKGKREGIVKAEKMASYREMPFSDGFQAIFRCMDEGRTIAFHCTEGKDRTGMAAALIEFAFGRSYDQILEEYLRSNVLRPAKDRSSLKYLGFSEELLQDIHFCEETHEELLMTFKAAALAQYGSLTNYLEKQFAITPERVERWKAIYLENC